MSSEELKACQKVAYKTDEMCKLIYQNKLDEIKKMVETMKIQYFELEKLKWLDQEEDFNFSRQNLEKNYK